MSQQSSSSPSVSTLFKTLERRSPFGQGAKRLQPKGFTAFVLKFGSRVLQQVVPLLRESAAELQRLLPFPSQLEQRLVPGF